MKVSFSELQINQELKSGKYKIVEKLGSGGFGITYKASYIKEISIKEGFHEVKAKVEVPVAIKELFIDGKCIRDANGSTISLQGLEVKDFEHFRLRFLQEAETLADFHEIPQVVQVIDYFEENNTAYMVMNFVDGVTLANHVKSKGPMQEASVRYLITEVASGLKEVHASQILHRDISPENIILTPENKVVLIDFGAARAFLKDKTVTNSTILKPGYAPIEQYGQKRRKGPWTDIYALGATSWFALTTEKPVDTTDRISGDNPFVAGNASEQMNAWLEKATAYEGSDRFADCAEVLDFWRNDNTQFIPAYEADVNKTRYAPAIDDQADNDRTQVWEFGGNASAAAPQSKKQDATEEEAITNSSPAYLYDTLVVLAFLFTLGLIGVSLFVLFGKGGPTQMNIYVGYFIFYIFTGLYFTISFIRKRKPRSFMSYWAYGSFFSLFAFFLTLPSVSISSFFIALPALPIFILFSRNLGGPRSRGQQPEQTPPYSFAYRPVLVPVVFYTALALYVTAFFLPVYKTGNAYLALVQALEVWHSFPFTPNILFTVAAFFFLMNYHRKAKVYLILTFLISAFAISMWWIFLKEDNKLLYLDDDIKDFKSGYYCWGGAIIALFLVVIFDALKQHPWKKYFWVGSISLLLALGAWYTRNSAISRFSVMYQSTITDLDLDRFKEVVESTSTDRLKAESPNALYALMNQYANHPDTVKTMFGMLWSKGALDDLATYRKNPLHIAAWLGDKQAFDDLLNGAAGNYVDSLSTLPGGDPSEGSLLYAAVSGDNPDIVSEVLNRKIVPAEKENVFEASRSREVADLLRLQGYEDFDYVQDFSDGTTGELILGNGEYRDWQLKDGGIELLDKSGSHLHENSENFPINPDKSYTIKVTINRTKGLWAEAGIIFDKASDLNFHIIGYDGQNLRLYRYDERWNVVQTIPYGSLRGDFLLEIIVNRNNVSIYMNGNEVISNQYFRPFGGNGAGFVVSNSKKFDKVWFDNFEISGKRAAPNLID